MDLQFIKLLNKHLIPEYSYCAYTITARQYNFGVGEVYSFNLGKPFIFSLQGINIEDVLQMASKENDLLMANDHDVGKLMQSTGALFTFAHSQFLYTARSMYDIFVKYALLNSIRITDGIPFFKDKHMQANFNMANGRTEFTIYENIYPIKSIGAWDVRNFIQFLNEYRFVNLSFTNITCDYTKPLLDIIQKHITNFKSKFKYTALLSSGNAAQYSFIDKLNICYFKYTEFYPTFINDDIYCLMIQLTSEIFDDLRYYSSPGYVQTYMLGGSNYKDDLLEIDGDKNTHIYGRVDAQKILESILVLCNNYTKAERSKVCVE